MVMINIATSAELKDHPGEERRASMPKVLIIGGLDVDKRIEMMNCLRENFDLVAAGSSERLAINFTRADYSYYYYPLVRGINPFADLYTFIYLRKLLRQIKPQIVHAFDTKPAIWGRFAAKVEGIPVIIGTLPGLGRLYAYNNFFVRFVRFFYQLLQKRACFLSDLTIFQNSVDEEEFIQSGLVPEHSTKVILGSGVRTDIFSRMNMNRDVKRLKDELGISAEQIVVTMVSRIIRSKGVLEFARAAELVGQEYKNTLFLLVGSKDKGSADCISHDEFQRVIRHVSWLGERDDIPSILNVSDIFVLPSFYREGIPRVLLEAASMSLPIVTTDSPGCREVVRHGENGFLVPERNAGRLTEAISRLVDESGMRRQFGRLSRKRAVENFDLNRISEQIGRVYRDLLTRKGWQVT